MQVKNEDDIRTVKTHWSESYVEDVSYSKHIYNQWGLGCNASIPRQIKFEVDCQGGAQALQAPPLNPPMQWVHVVVYTCCMLEYISL